jgi:hypothetical protein
MLCVSASIWVVQNKKHPFLIHAGSIYNFYFQWELGIWRAEARTPPGVFLKYFNMFGGVFDISFGPCDFCCGFFGDLRDTPLLLPVTPTRAWSCCNREYFAR